MKRIGALILVLCLCLSLAPAVSAAESGLYSYELLDGEVWITRYNGNEEHVTVPATLDGYPVAGIRQLAFNNVRGIKTMTFSEGIAWAEIEFVFNCPALESIHFPSTMNPGYVGDCESLRTMTVAPGNPYVMMVDNVMYSADMTTLVMLPQADPRQVLEVPDGVRVIGESSCEYNDNLREVILPDSVETVGYWAFNNCNNLEKVDLGEGCAFIGQYAFHQTSLTSFHLPAATQTLVMPVVTGYSLLEEPSLKSITVDPANPVYYAADGVLIQRAGEGIEVLACYPAGNPRTSYTVPENVKMLDWYCFDGAKHLEEIKLPADLRYIENSALQGCEGLKHLEIPDTVWRIASKAFYDCHALESVRLPAGLTELPDHLFVECNALREIQIPESVTSIGNSTFFNCDVLTEITIPAKVTSIGRSAFLGCTGLETVTFTGDAPNVASDAFEYVTATAVYPQGNPTWNELALQNFGGQLTWEPSAEPGPTTPEEPDVPDEPTAPALPGDLGGDGVVNSDDAIYLLYHTLFGGEQYPLSQNCDYNGDGMLTGDDAIYLLYHTLFGSEQYPLEPVIPELDVALNEYKCENVPLENDPNSIGYAAVTTVYTVGQPDGTVARMKQAFEEAFGFVPVAPVQSEYVGTYKVEGYEGPQEIYKYIIWDETYIVFQDVLNEVYQKPEKDGWVWVGYSVTKDTTEEQMQALRAERDAKVLEISGKTLSQLQAMRPNSHFSFYGGINYRTLDGQVLMIETYYCVVPRA